MAETIGRSAEQQRALNELDPQQRCVRLQTLLAPVFAQILEQLPDLFGPIVPQIQEICRDLLTACQKCARFPEMLDMEIDWAPIYRGMVPSWRSTGLPLSCFQDAPCYRITSDMVAAMLYLSQGHEESGMTAARKVMNSWVMLLAQHMDYKVPVAVADDSERYKDPLAR